MRKKQLLVLRRLFEASYSFFNDDFPTVVAKIAMGRYGKARKGHKWAGLALIAFGSMFFIFSAPLLLLGSVEDTAGFFIGVVMSSTTLICGIVAIKSPEKFNLS